MSTCRVLGDAAVHDILIGLSHAETLEFQDVIKRCLIDFSTTKEREYQPSPGIINRPNGQKTLFRTFTSPDSVGVKIIVHPASKPGAAQAPLHGILALCDENGLPNGLVNAEEVTGYRTSMAAMIPYMWRRRTETVLVFGAGKQAVWHIRLILALRGSEIKNITVINRSVSRAEEMLKTIEQDNQEQQWHSGVEFECIDPSQSDYDQRLTDLLKESDAIFCTVPTKTPLFPAAYLSRPKGEKQPYVSAIGSWQPDMIELDTALLKVIVEDREGYNANGGPGGAIIVDDRDSGLDHAGEVVQSKLSAEKLVELGEILARKQQGQATDEKLDQWLQDGFVVYKSVGVSVMDLASGNAILSMAAKRELGTSINDF